MKTLKITDVTDVPVEDLRPGHVVAEGVVVETRSGNGCVIIETAGGTSYTEDGHTVQVYARLNDGMTEAFLEAVKKSSV